MKRPFLVLLTLTALVAAPILSADAAPGGGFRGGRGGGRGIGRGASHGIGGGARLGIGRGFGSGFGIGGFLFDDGGDLAELYRELLQNVPYYALHPPVYYSYPVPRTYGYSPFAYPPGVMTPEITMAPQPETIINPHVPAGAPEASAIKTDTSASVNRQPEPLVIYNPYVDSGKALARSQQ